MATNLVIHIPPQIGPNFFIILFKRLVFIKKKLYLLF